MVIKCGIKPEYFWKEMSYRETDILLKAYYTKQDEEYKFDMNERRWLGFIMAVGSGLEINGKKITKPTDLRKFTWDIEEVVDKENIEKTKEDLLKIMERL